MRPSEPAGSKPSSPRPAASEQLGEAVAAGALIAPDPPSPRTLNRARCPQQPRPPAPRPRGSRWRSSSRRRSLLAPPGGELSDSGLWIVSAAASLRAEPAAPRVSQEAPAPAPTLALCKFCGMAAEKNVVRCSACFNAVYHIRCALQPRALARHKREHPAPLARSRCLTTSQATRIKGRRWLCDECSAAQG